MADYAISNVPRRVVYAASGTGPYAFTFEILNQTDIAVYKGSTLLTLTTDYSVTINANGTGSVTLVVTAGTSNITIVGAKNIQRTTDFTTGGDLFANTLNDELDNQTIYIQQVAETAERGLKAPVTDPTDIAMTLPAKDGRKGKVLAFDSTTGNPVAGPSLDSVVTVIEQSANINTVADNIASVNTVAGNTSNINTVAGVSSNVTTVAGSISNVNTVASDLNEPVSEINTVATDIANVNLVGTNISNVNAVAGNETNINAVVSNATNINAVAGNSTNINTVATNNANVTTVATNIASVNTNATNISNINQNAANITAIQNASANATAAANSANAAAGSATSASASAAAASAVALGNEPVRHSVRPSLLLDFANTKTLDPRITFTRGSTGTYYDGKTVAKAEENLLVNSQTFETNWIPTSVTITSNTVASPDLTTTADTMTANATTAAHTIQQSSSTSAYAPVSGLAYTISVYAKKNTNDFFQIATFGSGGVLGTGRANFDLATGVVGTVNGGTSTITSVGNGWYRCSYTVTASASGIVTIYFGLITTSTAARFESWTAVGTESIYLWGAQVEQRDIVTAYTATTTAPITNYIPALQTAASGVARFEHNPTTGESLGLEIEEQRTNLFNYSEQFDNAYWTKVTSSITANAVVAPDGTLTADKVVPNSGVSGALTRAITPSVSTSYTFSVYAKAGENSLINLSAGGTALTGAGGSGADRENRFNLALGTIEVSNSSPTITPVGNGWYRLTIMLTTDSDGGSLIAIINAVSTGNGFAGIYIWGAQLEAGTHPTSYIPTVASQVTRSAELAIITGTNFSSWYRADEGTLYAECGTPVTTGYIYSLDRNTGAFGPRIQSAWTSLTQQNFAVVDDASATVVAIGRIGTKAALAFKVNDFAAMSDGSSLVAIDTAGSLPSGIAALRFGVTSIGTNYLNTTLKKFAYYPKRLTNAELQGLTTV